METTMDEFKAESQADRDLEETVIPSSEKGDMLNDDMTEEGIQAKLAEIGE